MGRDRFSNSNASSSASSKALAEGEFFAHSAGGFEVDSECMFSVCQD